MSGASGSGHPSADYRSLPSVSELLSAPVVAALGTRVRPQLLTALVQEAVGDERQRLARAGGTADRAAIMARLTERLEQLLAPSLRPVINATGIILQTNLGRAPVSTATAAAMAEVASTYTPLEFDLETGRRGDRMAGVTRLLVQLTGAEDALVVNNNAAAILLALTALAAGREVVLSRGEAVEIGGGFRVPDVMAQSGARLVEVGTTNRTYRDDYARAITDQTAALLKVHPSNFRIIGFTHGTSIGELAALAVEHGLIALDDLGSGALLDTASFGLAHEPMISESVAAGAAVVCASGDKLLGGPQAGVLVGRRAAIERLRRHPLARAIRADKTCLAGLEATLRHYLAGEALTAIPIWRMIAATPAELAARAAGWQARLAGLGIGQTALQADRSAIGGGSLPGETLPTTVLAVSLAGTPAGEAAALRRLRLGRPPVIARAASGNLLLDPRTVAPEDDAVLPTLVAAALSD